MRKVLSLGIALCFALSLFSGVLGLVPAARAATLLVPSQYASIQLAVNAAVAGDTINVAAGTYSGNINVTKSLTIVGDPGDATPGPGANAPVIDGGSAPGDAFKIANGVSNVTIKGFEIRNFTSNNTGIGNGISAWVASTSNVTIQDNWFHNLGWNGVLVGNDTPFAGSHTGWAIKNNILETFEAYGFELTNTSNSSIENNIIHADLTSAPVTCIMIKANRSQSGITIKGNTIDGAIAPWLPAYAGYAPIFVAAGNTGGGVIAPANLTSVLIENNTISATGGREQVYLANYASGAISGVHAHGNRLTTFRNSTSAAVDATNNWWGTTDAATIALRITGGGLALVTYSPYLPGFAAIAVPANYASIQAAIYAANVGDAISVATGLYKESNIVVDRSVTIQGVGTTRDDVVVAPAAEDGNADSAWATSAQNGFIIKAHDVTIKNLTINGRGNPDLTAGKSNFRAGVVTLDASQTGGGAWNNLHVDNVVVKYAYRRGISVFPATVSGTVIENSWVEYVALNHGMYLAGQSEALHNTVKHCFQGIVQAPDATTPAGLIKANGNTLTEIGNFPGCWGDQGPGASPRYGGQPRAIQFNNSDSAGRQVEIKDNVIDDNGSTGLVGTVGIYTRLANADSVVDNNTITMTSGTTWAVDGGSQSVGLLLGWSYANGFHAMNNHVRSTGYGMGIMAFGVGTAAKPMHIEGNHVVATSSTRTTQGDGTGIYIANQYLFGTDKSPSYLVIGDGNTISGFVKGINAELIPTSTQVLTVIARGNTIAGNTIGIDASTMTTAIDATFNWWGTASGPLDDKILPGTPNYNNLSGTGNRVTPYVDYKPYWLDENMTIASDAVPLTVTVTGSGSVAKSPDQTTYTYGTSVQLTATPIVGWHFEGWSGDLTGSMTPVTVVMDWAKSITAAFAINRYTVTVSAGTNGRVSPGTGTFDYHTTQTYAVQPDPGYLIDTLVVDGVAVRDAQSRLGWTVTIADIDTNHTIAATFKPAPDVLAPVITLADVSTMTGITGWSGGAAPTFTVRATPFPLQFTLEDDRGGLMKWTIKVNGIVIIDPAGRGLITYSVPLVEGRNDVEVVAQDNAGNMASRKLAIYLDSTGPALALGILPASVSTPVLPITGSVVDAVSGLRSLTINGKAAVPFLDGFFHERLTLTKGVNTIVVQARDNAGNATSQTFSVTYGSSTTVSPSIYVVLTIGSTDMEVNGLVRKLDAAPFIKDGRTLLPIRSLIESLGGTVQWNAAARTATVSLGSRTVALTIGSRTALVNGKRITLDVAPIIANGRTFLPLRAIAENVGLDLAWEPISQTVSLTWWP